MTQRRELTREDAGTFEIKTGASVYVIDTQAATVVRVPVRERPGPNFDAAAALRRDQEMIRLSTSVHAQSALDGSAVGRAPRRNRDDTQVSNRAVHPSTPNLLSL